MILRILPLHPSWAVSKSPPYDGPVAQLDRAPDYESGGRAFESLRVRHYLNVSSVRDIWLSARYLTQSALRRRRRDLIFRVLRIPFSFHHWRDLQDPAHLGRALADLPRGERGRGRGKSIRPGWCGPQAQPRTRPGLIDLPEGEGSVFPLTTKGVWLIQIPLVREGVW